MNPITLLSPAKANLTFEIYGKRPDGYHEIKSIMQPVNLFDHVRIEIEDGNEILLNTRGIKIPNDESNLAYKAAQLYLEKSKIRKKINIWIDKKIPAGSGLGGGSSNAAATLVGLNRLLNLLDEIELMEISPKLGADVAFFIRCKSAIVEGIGEKITTLTDFPIFHYVVIYPKFEISTRKVYEKWDTLTSTEFGRTSNNEKKTEESKLEFGGISQIFLNSEEDPPVFNDLEDPSFKLYPVLKTYKKLMQSLEAKSVTVCGSGSCIFAVFREEKPARELCSYLASNKDIDTFLLKGISGWHLLAD